MQVKNNMDSKSLVALAILVYKDLFSWLKLLDSAVHTVMILTDYLSIVSYNNYCLLMFADPFHLFLY